MAKRKVHPYSHTRLVMGLTDMDKRMAKREAYVHASRLSLFLEAAERMEADVASGMEPRNAFMRQFTPNRDTDRIAKSFGWDIGDNEWNRA